MNTDPINNPNIDSSSEELESLNEARLNRKEEISEEGALEDELSPEELFKKELDEANNKYLRLYAEFDNYKRRTSRERVELLQTAGKDVIVDLLPVLDDLDRALKAFEDHAGDEAVKEGVQLVAGKLRKTLEQKGLKEMKVMHEVFDADVHEAITNIPAPSEDLKGKVVDQVLKGYLLNDKVLRYAKVVVGS